MKSRNQRIDNISCEEAIRRVFDYIDNHLNRTSMNEMERHLEICKHCYDRIEFEKQLKMNIRNMNSGRSSERLRKKMEELIELYGETEI